MKYKISLIEHLYIIGAIMLVLIGSSMNYNVVLTNDCKMPVHIDDFNNVNPKPANAYTDYVTFENKDEVRYYLLSDIIPVWLPYLGFGYFSIGDLMMLLGIAMISVFLVVNICYYIRRKKDEKGV